MGNTQKAFPKGIKVFKFSKVMKEFKKTKPLLQVLREMQVGEEVVVDNKQMKTATVRKVLSSKRCHSSTCPYSISISSFLEYR